MLSTKMLLMKCQSTCKNMLLCNKPNEITGFSHTVVQIFCPMVYYLVLGTCGIQEVMLKLKERTAANCVALAPAKMCRLRNTMALALHYRISLTRDLQCKNVLTKFKFWWTSIISVSLPTVCRIYLKK